jgi:hypothetical protein
LTIGVIVNLDLFIMIMGRGVFGFGLDGKELSFFPSCDNSEITFKLQNRIANAFTFTRVVSSWFSWLFFDVKKWQVFGLSRAYLNLGLAFCLS